MSLEASWSRSSSSKTNGADGSGGAGGFSEANRKDYSNRDVSSNKRGESDRRSNRDDRDNYRYSSRSRYSRSRDRISRDKRSSSRKRDDRVGNRRQYHRHQNHRSRSRSPSSSNKYSSSSSSAARRRDDKYHSRRHNQERTSSDGGGGGGGGAGSSSGIISDIGDSRDERKKQNDNIRILRASRSPSKSKSPESQNKLKTNQYQSHDQHNLDYLYKNDRSNSNTKIINSLDDDFDKERIHKEMQERLIEHLAREGKVYPPPKPQPASHPIFANDGSFLETFKKIQEQQQWTSPELDIRGVDTKPIIHHLPPHLPLHHPQHQNNLQLSHLHHQHHPHQQHHHQQQQQQIHHPPQYQQPPVQPVFGKRRGGKILKTGVVQKPKIIEENPSEVNQNDAWAMYLQEVKKYKNVSCDADSKTRPLVK